MIDFLNKIKSIDFDDNSSLVEYVEVSISYFDHFLDDDEYIQEELISFTDVGDDKIKLKYFNNIEKKIINFYNDLYKECGQPIFYIDEKNNLTEIEKNKYDELIINTLRKEKLSTIIFTNMKIISVTGYDLTHTFFILKEKKNINKIEQLAYINGLYVI